MKNDLDAYICVFEDCDQPEVLYNHSDQWLSHLQQHRRFWRCPSHRDLEPFSSGEDYIAHMREVHASKLSDKRLRAMANKNSRKIAKLFPSCPLCDKEESDINARLEDHLAGHLRSLALKSLPSYHENIPDDNEDGNNSIDISRPKSRSTVRDLREDEDYVPQYLFTSQGFWDRWRPPLVQAPWSNFLDQVYEDLDLIVNDTNSFFDTYSFQDLPNNLQNDRIIQHIMQCQEKQREASNDEHSKDRNSVGLENTPAIVETRPRRQLGSFDNWATNEAKATEELPTPTLSPVNPNAQETDGSAISPSVAELSSFYVSQHSVVAESEISDRRRPLIIDQKPSTILPVGTEPVRNPYTVGYTRLISSAPELFSGNREAARQRRREQDEREEAELEQRVRLRLRLRIAERNAKIASRPVAPAPPSPDKKSEKGSQNRSQDLVEQLERRDRRARLVARRKEQKEKEEKEEEERYRKLLRERMQPRRRLTTDRDSQRWPEFSDSEGLYRYSDDKPDDNGESSEQKGRPNANADENRYSVEGYTTDPGI